jgi:hypothetical protein
LAVFIAIRVMISVAVVITMLDDGGGLNGYLEVRAAAMVDPDSVFVEAPGAIQDALGLAILVDHFNPAGGIRSANVTVHVVRSTRHAQGLWHGISLHGLASGGQRQQERPGEESKRYRSEFVRERTKTFHCESLQFNVWAGEILGSAAWPAGIGG